MTLSLIRTVRYTTLSTKFNRMNTINQVCFLLILWVHFATPKPNSRLTSKSKAVHGSRGYLHICNTNLDILKLWIAVDVEKSQRKNNKSRPQRRRAINTRRRMEWNKRINKICCSTTCDKNDEREIRAIMSDDRAYRRYTIKHLRRSTGRSRKG